MALLNVVMVVVLMLASWYGASQAEASAKAQKQWKILHVTSYHMPWEWTDSQFNGFKDALHELNVEYKIFQMDTKRKNSREWLEHVGKEACLAAGMDDYVSKPVTTDALWTVLQKWVRTAHSATTSCP
jgi:CheY-like chemotaxis protein